MDDSLDDSRMPWILGQPTRRAMLESRVEQAIILWTVAVFSINSSAIDKGDMV